MSASGGTAYVRMAASAVAGEFSGNVVLSSAGADSKNVAVSGTVLAAGTPTFELTGTPLFPFFATFGQVSSAQSFTMTGTNLTGSVTVTPPSGFEISSDGTVFGTAPLVLPPTDGALLQAVSVRVSAAAPAGSLTGNIEVASADLTPSPTVALSATVSLPNFILALVPASIPENSASPSVATVTIPFARAEDLTVTLSSGNTAAATVPASVVIPATATAVTFDVTPVANPSSFAAQAAVIMVSATNFNSRSETLTVTNVDVAPITSISISSLETPYTQNFDGLGTATIAAAIPGAVGEAANLGAITSSSLNGWYAAKVAGNTSAASLSADTGSSNSGGLYNYGASASGERALGMLAGTNVMGIGALIKNDSAEALTGLKFSFTAEFWRNSTQAVNTLVFEYGKVDGSTITTSNFMDPALSPSVFPPMDILGPDFVSTNVALNGNDPANQRTATDVVVPVSLAPGETAFIRWKDVNDAGSDAGLAIDNLSIIGVTTGVAAPELSVIGGTYYADQNVKVSNLASYPFGTQIYYTLNGETPTAASSLYNDALGIDVLDGTGTKTLKAIAISGGVSSSTAISVYVLPTNVANLTALRAMPTGSAIYRVTGEVTFTGGTSFRNTKFFQDSAAGIQVDDSAAIISTVYAAGDNVKDIVGTLAVFTGQLQFAPKVSFGAPVSSGNAVTPLSRTLATLTDADEGMLVTVEEVSFESAGSFFASGATTNINDPSLLGFTGLLKNVFGDSNITSTLMPAGTATITGVVQDTTAGAGGLAIAPRNLADIVSNVPPGLSFIVSKTSLVEGLSGEVNEVEIKIRRTGDVTGTLLVNLTESEAGALGVDVDNDFIYDNLPNTVTFPVNSTEVIVYGIAKDNLTYLGNRSVTLTASATGMTAGEQVFSLVEDETAPPLGSSFSTWATSNAGGQGPTGDYDRDGVANGVEYFFGATGSTITANPGIIEGVISYPYDATATGVTYRVLSSSNLTSWADVTAQTVVGNGVISYTLPSGQGKLFIRLEVVVAPGQG
jgi:hypothetical protein